MTFFPSNFVLLWKTVTYINVIYINVWWAFIIFNSLSLNFPVLESNMVNINIYNPHKQKFFGEPNF